MGWLHETAASKLPAVYDLQEPFRWLVDLSVVETIVGHQLDRKADFLTTENYHVRLRPHAIGRLAERLSENFTYGPSADLRPSSHELTPRPLSAPHSLIRASCAR